MKPVTFFLIWCCVFGSAICETHYEDNFLTKFGVLMHRSNIEIIVNKDSLIITLIYDAGEMSFYWNNFVERGEHLLQFIGKENECVNQLLLNAKGRGVIRVGH